MQIFDVLLFFSSSIAFAIFLYWIIPLCRKRIFDYRHTAFKKRLVTDLINRAMGQRTKFRLEVIDGDLAGASGEGFCTQAKNGSLTIEFIETFAAQQWQNANCRIFFHIIQSQKTIFFHFTGKCNLAKRNGHFTDLFFDIPLQLESGQKRKSLRCPPPKYALLGMGIWPLGTSQPLPNSKLGLTKPYMSYRPDQCNEIVLYDISAGGMRIMTSTTVSETYGSKVKAGTHILCLLILNNPQAKKKKSALWLSSRVISNDYLESAKVWQTCMRFDTWATMEEGNDNIMWFPNDENDCVPTLAPIILRWNIELNKKNRD